MIEKAAAQRADGQKVPGRVVREVGASGSLECCWCLRAGVSLFLGCTLWWCGFGVDSFVLPVLGIRAREASVAWRVWAVVAAVCEAEMLSSHNFELLAQKLNDEVADQEKQLKATKKAKAEAEEAKSVAEGDLSSTQKGLKEDEASLHDLQENCMVKATAYDVEKQERAEEIKALETATQILQEKTGAASARTYSFLQVQSTIRAASKVSEKKDRVLAFVQKLANEDGTEALAQLLVRIKTTMGQAELDGDDPFAKVKGPGRE